MLYCGPSRLFPLQNIGLKPSSNLLKTLKVLTSFVNKRFIDKAFLDNNAYHIHINYSEKTLFNVTKLLQKK